MLAVSATLLCGCASNSERAGAPPIAVKVPAACERVLAPVALPGVSANDDARAAFVKDDAALIKAKAEIDRGRACIRRQRQLYATGGKGK